MLTPVLGALTLVVVAFLEWAALTNASRLDVRNPTSRQLKTGAILTIIFVAVGAILGGWRLGWSGALAGQIAAALATRFLVVSSSAQRLDPVVLERDLAQAAERFVTGLRASSKDVWGVPWREGADRALVCIRNRIGTDSFTGIESTKDGFRIALEMLDLAGVISHVIALVDSVGLASLEVRPLSQPANLEAAMTYTTGFPT